MAAGFFCSVVFENGLPFFFATGLVFFGLVFFATLGWIDGEKTCEVRVPVELCPVELCQPTDTPQALQYFAIKVLRRLLTKTNPPTLWPKYYYPALPSNKTVIGKLSVFGTVCKNYFALTLDIWIEPVCSF